MGIISALFIGKLADAAAREGLDRAALLSSCGVDPTREINPAQMVSAIAHYELWETIVRTIDCPGFPLRYAKSIAPDDYGTLGLATKTAPNLREAFLRTERYFMLLTDSSWLELRESKSNCELIFQREGARRLGMRCANEAAIAELMSHSRQISGVHLRPRRITFRHPSPGAIAEHELFFACPVEFEHSLDSIELEPSALDLPLLKADSGLSQFLLQHLDNVVPANSASANLERSLRRIISNALPSGLPKMEKVAKEVGMSRRTLQRRLADSDLSFQELVDSTRHQMAARLLRESPHPIGEISFLLGFSEQSAFQRAFKRWSGRTPAIYRTNPTV